MRTLSSEELAREANVSAEPVDVLVSENVARSVGADGVRFEPADTATLKGIAEPVTLFRALPR